MALPFHSKFSVQPMLRGLRQASSNWLGKIVMAAVVCFLIISFGIWGIGDIFRGFGVSTVAKVGGTEISVDQFRIRYTDQVQQLSRRVGRPVTAEQARAFGLEQQLLSQMIAFAALDERARQMGLGVSDAEVSKLIVQDPAFRGLNGQFDPNLFQGRIRENGFTEQRYVAEQRQGMLRKQLVDAIGADIAAPKTTTEAIERYRDEERSIEYVTLDGSKVGDIAAPTPEQLASYFDERKVAFRAPEYRKVQLITLSPEEMARTIEISDEDAKRAYETRLSRYSTPERRHVQQIVFPNAEEAQKASDQIIGGTSFDALAKERNLSDKDIDLGTVAKSEIIDPAVANAAFALADGAVSAPVTGRFGPAIVRVGQIEPGSSRPFADVAADIKHDLAVDRARSEVNSLRDKIEDEFSAGTAFADVAMKLKLPLRTIEAVDRSGRTPDGQPVGELPPGVDVVNSAFATDTGVENDPLPLPGGGFVWYDVASVTPSHERKLDEVKPEVETRWRDDEIGKRLAAKTTEILDKLKAGTSLADIAAADQLVVATKSGLKRQGSEQLPARAIGQIFRTAKDGVGSADGASSTERIIFRVTDIKLPFFDPNSPEVKSIGEQLSKSYNDELLTQYVQRLQTELGTSINPAAIDQAIGRGPQNP